jgi:membrane-associated protease RseP (regulator of RpoE activity)
MRRALIALLLLILAWGPATTQEARQPPPSYRPYVGIRTLQVNDRIARIFGLTEPRGALVSGIEDKSPASSSGLQPGDLILKFDGRNVVEFRDLSRIVAGTAVGKEVAIVIRRMGEEQTKVVNVGSVPAIRTPACHEFSRYADRGATCRGVRLSSYSARAFAP